MMDAADALRTFVGARAVIEGQVGSSQALDLAERLAQDENDAALAPTRSYAADRQDALERQVTLDIQAIADLAAQSPQAMTLKRTGLYETFVRSSADGLLLPAAVYVPANARRGGPLALILHGLQESETNLLALPYFRRLADRTGTVLVAPYARGAYFYRVALKRIFEAVLVIISPCCSCLLGRVHSRPQAQRLNCVSEFYMTRGL